MKLALICAATTTTTTTTMTFRDNSNKLSNVKYFYLSSCTVLFATTGQSNKFIQILFYLIDSGIQLKTCRIGTKSDDWPQISRRSNCHPPCKGN